MFKNKLKIKNQKILVTYKSLAIGFMYTRAIRNLHEQHIVTNTLHSEFLWVGQVNF